MKLHTVAMVSGPSLPINMVVIRISFAPAFKSGVIPVDSPTVPKALTVSNSNFIKSSSGSAMHIRKVCTQTTASASMAMRNAWDTTSVGIRRLNALQCLFVAALNMLFISTKVVVVLIPPPVEPGDAPRNIRTARTNSPAFENAPIG